MFSGLDYCYISEYLYGNSIPGTYLSYCTIIAAIIIIIIVIAIINVNSAKIMKAIIINITAGTIIY